MSPSNTTFPRRSEWSPQRPELARDSGGVAAARRGGRRLAVLALLASAALAAVGTVGGCADTSSTPAPIGDLRAPSLARLWAANLQVPANDEVTTVHVRDDWVIAYTKRGRAYALRRSDGTPVFAVEVPGGSFRLWAPVVLKEYIVFPTTDTLEVYDFVGSHVRSIEMRAAIRADCVGERTGVFVPIDSPNGGARLVRYDLANKNTTIPEWELQVWRGGVSSAPAIHTDAVYFAADVGEVYAVSADRRDPIWPLRNPDNIFDARSGIVAPLKADDVGVYIPCVDGKLYCVHRTAGTVRWQYYAQGALETAPVITADTVYVKDPGRGWVAIDKVDNPNVKGPQYNRAPRWANKDIAQVLSQDDKYVYAKDVTNHIAAYDKKTGVEAFKSKRSDFGAFGTNGRRRRRLHVHPLGPGGGRPPGAEGGPDRRGRQDRRRRGPRGRARAAADGPGRALRVIRYRSRGGNRLSRRQDL